MAPVPILERVFFFLSIAGYTILVLKLAWTKLFHVYRFFFFSMLAQLARDVALLPLNPQTEIYAWVWMGTIPIILALDALVVFELYSLVLREYPGIWTAGRWAMGGSIALALLIAGLSLIAEFAAGAEQYPVLMYFRIARRGVFLSLALFVILMMLFLAWYPVPLRRNVIRHAFIYSVYFLATSLALFVRNIFGPDWTDAISTIIIAITLVCLAVWIALLDRQGEMKIDVFHPRTDKEDEQRLLAQLEAINTTLRRSGKSKFTN